MPALRGLRRSARTNASHDNRCASRSIIILPQEHHYDATPWRTNQSTQETPKGLLFSLAVLAPSRLDPAVRFWSTSHPPRDELLIE
jgi:hypothetical protein